MKKLLILAFAACGVAAQAQFTEGNLVVALDGDGGSQTDNNPISLQELTTTGSLVGSPLSLTGLGGHNVTVTYGETSEAQVVRSGNGMYLTLCGYDLTPHSGTFSIFDTPRIVVRLANSKAAKFSHNFSTYNEDLFKGDGVRCAYSSNGNDFVVTGGDSGLTSGTFNTTPTLHFNGDLSSRAVTRFGNLYYYSGSNAFFGGNGIATWDGTANAPVGLFAAFGSSRDLWVKDANTIYVSHSTSAAGLVKVVFVNGSWTEAYRLAGKSINNFTVDTSGANPVFYVTSSNGANVLKTTDLGSSFADWTTLATAPSGQLFRGIDWAPKAKEAVPADAVVVSEGSRFSGNLASLSASDNNRYCAFNDGNSLGCSIEVTGHTTVLEPSEITFKTEMMVSRPGLAYELLMKPSASNDYSSLTSGEAPTADEMVDVSISELASSFVGNSGLLSGKISFSPINDEVPAQDGWLHCLDLASWEVRA